MMSFGQKIKKIRTDAGFSQAYLAELIGVSAQSVSNWECDNTMPDISQIVPLAGALSVSTDFLLGVGMDEANDRKVLEEKVDEIWAAYSVNDKENNADILVSELYSGYLRKYPIAYDIKYKCALALNDYVKVVEERHKFDADHNEIESAYLQCDKYLSSVIDNSEDAELKIKAGILKISHLLLRDKITEAMQTAEKLPETCGIKDSALSDILYKDGKEKEAKKTELEAAKESCLEYLKLLYKMARNDKEKALDILSKAEVISKQAVEMFMDVTELKINGYESMPYCYLITAYTMQCNAHIKESRLDPAYEVLEKALSAAGDMYSWVKAHTTDKQILEDYKFFAEHVPHWAYKFSDQFDSESNAFIQDKRFKAAQEKIQQIL